jgi:hypothetical protein
MQILDWITCRRVETKEFTSLFCLVLLSIFTHAAAQAEQPGIQAAPTPFESSTLGTPAHDAAMVEQRSQASANNSALSRGAK